MSRRLIVVLLLIVAIARAADAQIIRGPVRAAGPRAWTAGTIGLLQMGTVHDGSTTSTWNFGDAVQWRLTLEKPLQGSSAIGVAATFARVPLTFESLASGGCGTCDADASVTQVMAMFHSGGGSIGFHQVIELSLGTTIFSSFRERDTGTRLPPDDPDFDFAFTLGYGFGYALSPNLQVQLVQDFGTSLHQHTGLTGGESTTLPMYVTRIGVRYGLGR